MNRAKIITLFQPLAAVDDDVVSAFDGDPGALLPDARSSGHEQWRLSLHGLGLSREVDIHVGDVWLWGDAHWRSITWSPLSMPGDVVPVERLLPTFVGEIGLQVDRETLILTGAYHPPMGALGTIADAAALGAVARATGQHLLGEIAQRLTQHAHA